ncbi:MAG: hypothetical protein QNJ92_06845 [Alphaproteobacteria bacterium]|nr:hypothetical protein [Alphaproteobacteria bacterium]
MTTRAHNLTADQARAMQERRLTALCVPLKVQPPSDARYSGIHHACNEPDTWFFNSPKGPLKIRPSFQPGDVLVMKEPWGYHGSDDEPWPAYRASDDHFCRDDLCGHRWRSPVTMPRWASRITAIVRDVTVLRVQDVSEEQAIAIAGLFKWPLGYGFYEGPIRDARTRSFDSPIMAFRYQWNSKYSRALGFDGNPWCALADLDVYLCNVDQVKEAAE